MFFNSLKFKSNQTSDHLIQFMILENFLNPTPIQEVILIKSFLKIFKTKKLKADIKTVDWRY